MKTPLGIYGHVRLDRVDRNWDEFETSTYECFPAFATEILVLMPQDRQFWSGMFAIQDQSDSRYPS